MHPDNKHPPFGRNFAISIWDDVPSDWRDAAALVDRLSFEPSPLDAKPAGPKAGLSARVAAALRSLSAAIRNRLARRSGRTLQGPKTPKPRDIALK